MKRIRGILLTILLAVLMAAGGMAASGLLLNRVESQAVRKETEEAQEEIVLTEEETDRLVLILSALEADRFVQKQKGSSANIPAEKALSKMYQGLTEMQYLFLEPWVPEISYMVDNQFLNMNYELLGDSEDPSLEVYEITAFYHRDKGFSMELTGIMDARSGLLVALDMEFLEYEQWREQTVDLYTYWDGYGIDIDEIRNKKYAEEKSGESSTEGLADGYWGENEAAYSAQELRKAYSAVTFMEAAIFYYSSNTNFAIAFYGGGDMENETELEAEDSEKEYSIQASKEDGKFHFQLHKI